MKLDRLCQSKKASLLDFYLQFLQARLATSTSGNGKRHWCCKTQKTCNGKKCKVTKNNCKFVGPTHKRTFSTKCKPMIK